MTWDGAGVRAALRDAGYAPDDAVAVAVTRRGRLGVHAQGRTSAGSAFTADTVTYAASLAKQVTAAGVALLVRDGVLDTRDRLARWIPTLPGWADSVRLDHLLHHTAALPGDAELVARVPELRTRWTTPGVLAALAGVRDLEREPGAEHAYNNAGYVCLAEVVERASGEPFTTFAARRLLEPTGMASSRFWAGPRKEPPGLAPSDSPSSEPGATSWLSLGDGGLWTTAGDLARWNVALLRDDLGIARIVEQTGRLDDGTALPAAWGFSVRDRGGELVHTAGGNVPGVTGTVRRVPGHDVSLTVLTRTDGVERVLAATEALLDLALTAER
ncbi:beta-lactamase [Beutenbergia cavernae DSM 12333]|uniref:Beta-lactamase n=1 Tax=Beutenbergia cavernae (strain ATCC BAA-8 / DSM 12333 / CCUG 43141 / JCM 11478 / NBRC 16432 / NCIMB 13614 / HKI 0122) TaxID=471853 RepID=C5BWY6_BEUC1|nr:serine hydrolase domain-containing protein [Beutenbergia cavernae]ACQ80802.1 beta-lactamase [Beutenbergia cavernae DSM 12333]